MEENDIKSIKLFGEVIEGETLKDLQKQLGKTEGLKQLVVEIASPGGSVSEGLEIMVWLDNLSEQGIEVTTVVVANAYSIASLIMLAADVKLISKHGEVMVHNPMVPELEYVNANDLEKHARSLRGLESMMYELYEIFTGIDESKIKELMDNETFISPEDAVKLGFADMVIDVKKKSYEMTINIKKEINMSKAKNVLNRLSKVISMVNKAEFVNQLYYDKEGSELEIYQKDPSTYSKGDRTSLEKGSVTLSDGAKLTVEDFIISDIDKTISPEEEKESLKEDVVDVIEDKVDEKIEDKVEDKKDDSEKEVEKEPVDKDVKETDVEDNFNEGPAPKTEEEIVDKKEDSEKEMVSKEEYQDLLNKYDALEARIKGVEEKSAENMLEVAKFQEAATEAIDTIASNTTSNFKPDAKIKAIKPKGASIFKNALAKRGL